MAVFRSSYLDTVAGSAGRIFMCEGGCSGTVQVEGRVHANVKTQKNSKKANHWRF